MRNAFRSSALNAEASFIATALLVGCAGPARSDSGDLRSRFEPASFYLQAGVADRTEAYVLGATWDWTRNAEYRWGRASGYWESSIGQWRTDKPAGGRSTALVTQIGLTPVLRLSPSAWRRGWFAELGIGANVLFPVYRNDEKAFSTAFNFGDHIAVGRRFGQELRQETSIRFQHFSNAGIKHPNPGENFIQLRYAYYIK